MPIFLMPIVFLLLWVLICVSGSEYMFKTASWLLVTLTLCFVWSTVGMVAVSIDETIISEATYSVMVSDTNIPYIEIEGVLKPTNDMTIKSLTNKDQVRAIQYKEWFYGLWFPRPTKYEVCERFASENKK